jgi:hypothetical protein
MTFEELELVAGRRIITWRHNRRQEQRKQTLAWKAWNTVVLLDSCHPTP